MTSRGQAFRIHLDRNNAVRMSCVNANCEAERKGWVTVLDVQGDAKHAKAARWIEGDSGRQFTRLDPETAIEWIDSHGEGRGITLTPELLNLIAATPRGMAIYLFPPHQQCFRLHKDREVTFVHQRGNDKRVHINPLDFNEDFNESAYEAGVLRQREGIDEQLAALSQGRKD